jgi:hypothetical protein
MVEAMTDQDKPQNNPVSLTRQVCGPQCSDGTENHDWSGPVQRFGNGGTVTCAKCGMAAIDYSMWF